MPAGLVDTNVFIHAQSHDALAEECLTFLEAVERGEVEVRVEPLVVHELSYALPRYRQGMTRPEMAAYLLNILGWEGVVGDKEILVEAVELWRDADSLAFVDAYLAALARRDDCPVYSKNVADIRAAGVDVPSSLPH
jgi:predicted nucleic acid-binding protein